MLFPIRVKLSALLVAAGMSFAAGVQAGEDTPSERSRPELFPDAHNPPKAEEILALARQSRTSFIKVVSDMERVAADLLYMQHVYDYLKILGDLAKIGTTHGIETWGSNPVISLGHLLTQQSLKWMRFDEADDEVVAAFGRWANDETLHIAVKSHSTFIQIERDLSKLIAWNTRIAYFVNLIQGRPLDPYVMESAEQLQGEVIYHISLRHPKLTKEEVTDIMRNLVGAAAILKMGTYLENEVFAANDPERLNAIAAWAYALAARVRERSNYLPSHLKNAPGEIIMEALGKFLYLDSVPAADVFVPVVGLLEEKQLARFAGLFENYRWEALNGRQASFYLEFGNHVQDRLVAAGLHEHSRKASSVNNRLALVAKLESFDLEGSYAIDIDGHKGVMTIVDLGDKRLVVGLRLDKVAARTMHQDYTFTNVAYNAKKDKFEAHRVMVQDPRHGIPVHLMTNFNFRISASCRDGGGGGAPGSRGQCNIIRGKFASGGRFCSMEGEKITGIGQHSPHYGEQVDDITGAFEGGKYHLVVSNTGGKIAGALVYGKYKVKVNLNYGFFDEQKQIIYLTSGEMESGRMIHVRGYYRDHDHLEIIYVKGGQVKAKAALTLHRK